MNFTRTERFLLGISIWGILLLLLWPFVDWSEKNAPAKSGFAFVIPEGRDVRSKKTSEFDWKNLNRSQSLAEESRVFTGRQSKARVRFQDEGEMELQENTLVVLSQEASKSRVIEIQKGLVFLDLKGESVVVRVGNRLERISGRGARVKLEMEAGASAPKLTLVQGSISIGAGEKSLQLSDSGSSIEVSANASAALKVNYSRLKVLLPVDKQDLWSAEPEPVVNFAWSGVASSLEGVSFRVLDPQGQVLKEESLLETNQSLPLPTGEYQWEVQDTKTQEKVRSRFRVLPLEPPQIQGVRSQDGTLKISWEDRSGSEYWQITVSEDAQGERPVFTGSTYNQNLQTPMLPRGTYHVKVSSFRENRPLPILTSRLMSHWHDERLSPSHLPLKLAAKSRNVELVWAGARKLTPGFEHLDRPLINWSGGPPGARMVIQIAEDFSFEKMKDEFEAEGQNQGTWITGEFGKWYYRVRPEGPFSETESWSDVGLLRVIYAAPTLTGTSRDVQTGRVRVVWDAHPDNAYFEVLSADNPAYAGSTQNRIANRQVELPVPIAGRLHVKVRAISSKGWPISSWSEEAVDLPKPVLPDPVLPPLAQKEEKPPVPPAEAFKPPPLGASLATEILKPFEEIVRRAARFWTGLGWNYFRLQQGSTGVVEDVTFSNFTGPTLMFEVSVLVKEVWKALFDYHDQPGSINNAYYGLSTANSRWQSVGISGARQVADIKILDQNVTLSARAGLQRHRFPFLYYDNRILHTVNEIDMLNLGVDAEARLSREWEFESFLRLQSPLSGRSEAGAIRYNSRLSFDGSLGLVRLTNSNWRLGFYWFGQLQALQYQFMEPSGQTSGPQTFFNSNIQLRLGYDIPERLFQ